MKHPTPEWMESAACAGKHRFDDHGLAEKVARQSAKRKDKARPVVYRCPACNGWHIGHQRRRGPEGKRKDGIYEQETD